MDYGVPGLHGELARLHVGVETRPGQDCATIPLQPTEAQTALDQSLSISPATFKDAL